MPKTWGVRGESDLGLTSLWATAASQPPQPKEDTVRVGLTVLKREYWLRAGFDSGRFQAACLCNEERDTQLGGGFSKREGGVLKGT